jgi:hypothetical protein
MRKFQGKKVVDKIKTHVLFSISFLFFENRAVYEITWKNTAGPGRPQAHAHCMLDT